MPFVERGIQFIKTRVRCIRSMIPTRVRRIPRRLMIEMVYAVFILITSIRRKGGVHPVMSPRQILTGEKLVVPTFPIGSFCYAIPENKDKTSSIVDKERSFDAIYLRPNTSGSGHFVYNINTMQRCSATRVIGYNGEPIPWSDLIIKTVNAQGVSDYQPEGLVIGD